MRASAIAQPNIALIKYWGKRNIAENLPATGSLSITLASLTTRMTVGLDDALRLDELKVNGETAADMLPRVSACLDHLLGTGRAKASIDSECNFPIAAGLASSASSFAALVVAASHAAGRDADTLSLARAAGRASGSAARSLYGGFVELQASAAEIQVGTLLAADEWPMQVVVAVTAKAAKKISSGDAMNLSAETSPFYASWVEHQDDDLRMARGAVAARDFAALAKVSLPENAFGHVGFATTGRVLEQSHARLHGNGAGIAGRWRAGVFHDRCGAAGQSGLSAGGRRAGTGRTAADGGRHRHPAVVSR